MDKRYKEAFYLILSSILTAICVNFIFIFSHLAPGGITGMSIVFSYMTGFSVANINLIISSLLLGISVIFLGGKFGVKTLFLIIMNYIFLRIVPQIEVLSIFNSNEYLYLFISAVFGGILIGMSVAFALNCEASTGGTDVVSLLIKLVLKNVPLHIIVLFFDTMVIISSGFVTKNIKISIFSWISLFIISNTIKFLTSDDIKKILIK